MEQTRALVASLQTAVHFIEALSESLAVVTQLLASSTMTDVQESITLLIYCHKFQVWPYILTVESHAVTCSQCIACVRLVNTQPSLCCQLSKPDSKLVVADVTALRNIPH